MSKFSKTLFSFFSVSMFSFMFYFAPVQAHEPRLIAGGALNVVVGWKTEPAFEKVINAFDFTVADPIDITDIELEVTALYLDDDASDAKVIKSTKLTDELRRDRSNPNHFNKYFLPSKAGAYGFHIMGMVNGIAVDEIFICGGGTQNADGRSFGCIDKPQSFPGGGKKHHDRHDND